MTGVERNISQVKYQLLVSSSQEKAGNQIGDLFDSGVVESGVCSCDYRGEPLQSCQRCYWQVRACDPMGVWTDYSDISVFEMGLLEPSLWEGRYIGVPNEIRGVGMFRKRFHLDKPVKKARAYLATQGFSEFYVNGQKQGDAVLEPANTDFNKRLLYVTYDITTSLQEGDNAFGVMLSNGWSNHGKFRMQAYVWFEDGTRASYFTYPMDWYFIISPILSATIFSGEIYNAIYERPEWYSPSDAFEKRYHLEQWRMQSAYMPLNREENPQQFDKYAHAYYHAMELSAPSGRLQAQMLEPIKIHEQIEPVSIVKNSKEEYVVDFGQNFAGWVSLKMQGPASHIVTMRFSELQNEDGTLNMEYLTVADPTYPLPMQTDAYFLKGEGEERYRQRFTYHGFRYMSVENYPGTLKKEDVMGYVVYSGVRQSGSFTCGSELINQIQRNIIWTEKANLYGIPTDCPQRAERQGWLNDLTARAEESVYNFDLSRFYTKFARDIADTQDDVSGAIGDTAPLRRGYRPGDPVDCFTLIPSLLYDFYGDERPAAEHYGAMKKLADFLTRNSQGGLVPFSFWGDWASPVANCGVNGLFSAVSAVTPGDLVSSGYLYFNVKLLLKFARVLHRDEDVRVYERREEQLRLAFNRHYYNGKTKNYGTGSQGCNAFALYLGVVPEADTAEVVRHIAEDVAKCDYHLTTGNLFTKYLLEMLTQYGYVDTAYKLAVQTTYPSWGYMIEMGATTIWERWEHATGCGMNSHSHPMYGSVSAWYYKYLAGLSADTPGYRQVLIKPYLPQGLAWAQGELETLQGRVSSRWEKKNGSLEMRISVPGCTQANLSLPCKDGQKVCLDKKPLLDAEGFRETEGVAFTGRKDGRANFTLGSGEYVFTVKN